MPARAVPEWAEPRRARRGHARQVAAASDSQWSWHWACSSSPRGSMDRRARNRLLSSRERRVHGGHGVQPESPAPAARGYSATAGAVGARRTPEDVTGVVASDRRRTGTPLPTARRLLEVDAAVDARATRRRRRRQRRTAHGGRAATATSWTLARAARAGEPDRSPGDEPGWYGTGSGSSSTRVARAAAREARGERQLLRSSSSRGQFADAAVRVTPADGRRRTGSATTAARPRATPAAPTADSGDAQGDALRSATARRATNDRHVRRRLTLRDATYSSSTFAVKSARMPSVTRSRRDRSRAMLSTMSA